MCKLEFKCETVSDPGPLSQIPRDHTPPSYKFVTRPNKYELPNKYYLGSAMDQGTSKLI